MTTEKTADESTDSSSSGINLKIVSRFSKLEVDRLQRQGAGVSQDVQQWLDGAHITEERLMELKIKSDSHDLHLKLKMPS